METKKNCPYCGIAFSLDGVNAHYVSPRFSGKPPLFDPTEYDPDGKKYSIASHKCPECRKQIMWLNEITETFYGREIERKISSTTLLFPKYPIKQISPEVPENLASDFREAHATLYISPLNFTNLRQVDRPLIEKLRSTCRWTPECYR